MRGLDGITLTAEAKYPIHFTQSGQRYVSSPPYNRSNSFLFVNDTKIYQFQTKDSEIKDHTLCLINTSKNLTIINMKKTGLRESQKFFFC